MNTATYCPEDNKLRLYVGRVPRDEYLKLRAAGWVSTPKQSCDFVATWTPSRRATCLEYADLIEDEDQTPEERAADRAERFGEYRDKRTDEATGHADRYEAGPSAHGYQSAGRAERAAARHDRIGDRAGDAWSKAEYWTRRTAGVIGHALYKSTPGVRMGRIKVLEAELRKYAVAVEKSQNVFKCWQDVQAIADPEKQTKAAILLAGCGSSGYSSYLHPRLETVTNARLKEHPTDLHGLLTMTKWGYGTDDITGAEACALYFSDHGEPAAESEWSTHYALRLAYENQMLEAQGGRLEQCEVLPGGKFCGKLILKVSKSTATGRATSVSVLGPRVEGYAYKTANIPGTEWAEHKFDLERYSPEAYTSPTPESLAEFAQVKAKIKAGAKSVAPPPCPLINPTDEDAERLQAIWNEIKKAEHEANNDWKCPDARAHHTAAFEPATVTRITQAVYSANAKGSYNRAETRGLCADALLQRRESNMYSKEGSEYDKKCGRPLCTIRITNNGKGPHGWSMKSVIVLTDKPQKPLPAAVWAKHEPKAVEVEAPTFALESEVA